MSWSNFPLSKPLQRLATCFLTTARAKIFGMKTVSVKNLWGKIVIPVKTVYDVTTLWDFENSLGSVHQHKIGRAAVLHVRRAEWKQLKAGRIGVPPSSPWPCCLLHCVPGQLTLFLHCPAAWTSCKISLSELRAFFNIFPFGNGFMFLDKGLPPCPLLPQNMC